MQAWDDILATAVVGTEQREFKLATREDELGRLLGQLSSPDREGSLLSAAAVVALYRSAGTAPPADTQALPEACADDEASRGSVESGRHLTLMLEGEFSEVLPEWFAAMKQAGKRVAEEHLPALLDYGREEVSLRGMIAGVLGRRGEWLATQNPDWSYALHKDARDVWETGSREERILLLEDLRKVDPTRARELVATTWTQESARDRVAFLEKFALSLNAGDEAFLDEALHDRSAEVRRVARPLLAALPSQFSARVKDLANQLLSFKKPLIGKSHIEVSLPDDPIAWLKTNGVEIDTPPRTRAVGPKAWALKSLISLVPIAHWNELWQKTPLEIIRAADETDWRESFIAGFSVAAQRDRNADWIETLVVFTASESNHPPITELAAYLPANRLEALILKSLASGSAGLSDGHSTFRLLLVHHGAWSDRLSRAVVHALKERISRPKDNVGDWQIKAALKQFARYVSPALHDELAAGWPSESELWPSWSKHVDAFQSLLAFRRDLHRAISEKEQKS